MPIKSMKKLRKDIGIKDSFDQIEANSSQNQQSSEKNDESLKQMNSHIQEYEFWQRRAGDSRQWAILIQCTNLFFQVPAMLNPVTPE